MMATNTSEEESSSVGVSSQSVDSHHENTQSATDRLPKAMKLDFPAMGLDFHPGEDFLAAGLIDGTVKFYSCSDSVEPEEEWSMKAFTKSCRRLRFTETGEGLVCISKDKSWKILNVETGKVEKAFKGAHEHAISSVAVAGTNYVVTGDDDGKLKLWDLRKDKAVFEAKQNEDYLSDIAIDDQNRILFATSGDGTMSTYNIKRRRFDVQSLNLRSELMCVDIVRRGRKVVVGCSDGSLNFYNHEMYGDISDRFPGHPDSVDVSCKILDDLICTGCGDGTIRAVNVFPHKFLGVIGDHGGLPVNGLTINAASTVLASCGSDQKIKFWDVEHFHHIGKIERGKNDKSIKNKRLNADGKEENFFSDLV